MSTNKMPGSQPGGNIIVENHCPYCNQDFDMSKRSFANHMKYCDMNPKVIENMRLYGKKTSKATSTKISESSEAHNTKKFGPLLEYQMSCEKCGKVITVYEREKKHPEREHYFCSRNCANSHNYSQETCTKISQGLRKWVIEQQGGLENTKYEIDENGDIIKVLYKHHCPYCHKDFRSNKKDQECCCNEHASKMKIIRMYENLDQDIDRAKYKAKVYHRQCAFRFALNAYPEEFDFNLIKEHGWYKAKNHGDNLYGVSRDHLFSVNEGMRQGIDPYYISHPANCKLILQSENASKHSHCSISIEELIHRIDVWNKKYGTYPNRISYDIIDSFIKVRYNKVE